ncbi:MAG: CP12 domain-containing protein [Cyanobacteriota bacterium]|jgi:CP12 domain|nr:CP12 domain-containing protein [Cyanobacteriota bacterium]
MASIADQLNSYRSALEAAQANGDEATRKKLEQNIQDLEAFSQRHPEATEAPSPLEVFCDLNPSDINCLVYDD